MARTTGPVRLVVGVFMAAVGTVSGADFNWLPAGGGNWSTPGNWSGGAVATGAANVAVFPASSDGAVINVDRDSDVGTLRFSAGSRFTLSGSNVLSSGTVEVDGNQVVMIDAPVACAGWFYKGGVGIAAMPNLAVASGGVQVRNGCLLIHSLGIGNALLGDWTTPAGGLVALLLTTSGDAVANEVWLGGYSNNFARVVGGANTNGVVSFPGINGGAMAAHNEIVLTAAAGGQVDVNNITGNSGSPLVKIGPGTVRMKYWGDSAANRSYAGGTTIRNGTLLLGEDDIGVTTNGYTMPNGRASNGAGGSLGYSDFPVPVQLGDVRYAVTGSGGDIWGASDEFHYLCGTLSGDGQMVTRVTFQQNTDGWAKSGLMMRETLDANSRHVLLSVTPGNGITFQWRDTAGGECSNASTSAKAWLKLVRAGNVFSGYVSDDGAAWALVGSAEVIMDGGVRAGLAVTAHNNALVARTDFAAVSGLPAGAQNYDIGGVGVAGSGVYTGTAAGDDVALVAESTRWIGHVLKVNAVGREIAVGGRDAGTCTFAGPIALDRSVCLTAPGGGTALFTGGIGGTGNVIKTGMGVVGLGGGNTYTGSTVVSNGTLRLDAASAVPENSAIEVAGGVLDLNGCVLSNRVVTVRGGKIAGGELAGGACAVIGPNVLDMTLSGDARLTKSGPGTLLVTAPQAYTGPTTVAGGVLRLAVPGLYEGRLSGAFNLGTPNPRTSIQLTTRYANSTDLGPWSEQSTFVYSGTINNTATQAVTFVFGENFDDYVALRIDGATVLYDNSWTAWNNQTTNSVVLSPGPHAFDLRLGQSIGGVGPASGSGINGNTGLGVGYSTDGGITWQALTDTGTGEFLDTGAAAAHLPSATALSIASGALVDLNGASQTVAAVSGSGVVTNGDLVVTGTLSPSGAGSAGVLTIQGNLRVSEGATVDWDFSSASADRVDVAGTLALPSRAFLTLNGQGATLGMRPMVLFTFRTYNGAPDLSGWSVDRAAKLTVDRVNSQVILTGGSTVMVLK